MTDDFHLFEDPDDGAGPVDPDLALITAYLARELSPMQVLALEERLASDAAFRSEMQPLIDAWAAPVPSLEGGLAKRTAPLSALERAESWRRFQSEGQPISSTEPIAFDVQGRTTRRISMKRLALLTAAVALPMVSFAQVVVYAADHADFPGHRVAQEIVSAFTNKTSASNTSALVTHPSASQPTTITDTRVARPLSEPKVAPAESAVVAPPTAPTPTPASIPSKARGSIPDRALIADLIRRYHLGLVRGDTTAEYVVMVLDAAQNYVWSTLGDGNVGIQVGADSRQPAERARFTLENRDEFWGSPETRTVGRGARGYNGGYGMGAPGRGRAAAAGFGIDSTRSNVPVGRGRGMVITTRISAGDTIFTLQYDSITRHIGGRGSGAFQAGGLDSAGRGFGARGRGAFVGRGPGLPGTYRVGWLGPAGGAAGNRAPGLEPVTGEKSGVQGLEASSVESADTYFFSPGELTTSALRVMVVWLTPTAVWHGPS